MDLSAVIQIIILIILLGLSAFFSSAETSLTTINKIRLRSLAEEGNRHAKMALKVTDNSGKIVELNFNRQQYCESVCFSPDYKYRL